MGAVFRFLLVAAGVLGVAACEASEEYGTPPPKAPTPAPAQSDVIAQYLRFWGAALPAAFNSSTAEAQRAALAPVTAEPELGLLLHNLATLRQSQERGYGRNLPLRQSVSVRGAAADVIGCLDSSGTGKVSVGTGRALTHGVGTNPVRVQLVRGDDRVWRVSAVVFPGGNGC